MASPTNLVPNIHQRKYLERASEENINNAKVSRYPNKSYQECLDAGWLVELPHPVSGYYYKLTEEGEVALRTKPTRIARAKIKLVSAPPRIAQAPPRLQTIR